MTLSIKTTVLPNGKLIGTFKLAGITWKTNPANSAEEIYANAKKLEEEYKRMIEEKRSPKNEKL